MFAALLLLSVGPSARLSAQCPDGTPPPCRGARAPVAAPVANSVAVLYFENLSRDTADAYLADGLSEEITTRLGQVPRLTVTARTTMRRHRASTADPAALARTLRVAHLVSGSIRRGPGRLRVGVELIRARDGVQLWSESYDRTDNDVLAIEADVARAVATAIAGRLLPDETARIAARPTRNPAAYDRLLRGNFLIARRSNADALRAMEEYEAATRIDPAFADAYAMLGWTYGIFHGWYWVHPTLPRESLVTRSREAADRAVRLDSTSALAWMAVAAALGAVQPLRPELGLPAGRRAVALDPRSADAHYNLGISYITVGDLAQGRASLARALELDPERPITLSWLANAMIADGRPAEARRYLDSALTVAPNFAYALTLRIAVRALQGDIAGALADAEAARASGDDQWLINAVRAFAHATAGDTAAARNLVRLATPAAFGDEVGAWTAAALVRIGDHDGALSVLERTDRNAFLRYYLGYAMFEPLRPNPRFQRLQAALRPQ